MLDSLRHKPLPAGALQGQPVAPGIAIGPAFFFEKRKNDVAPLCIAEADREAEVERYEKAVRRAHKDLQKIIGITEERLGDDSAEIFQAQAMMLDDADVANRVKDCIRQEGRNADFAVYQVFDNVRQRLESSATSYLRERAHDVQDVSDRLIRHLRAQRVRSDIPEGSIVFADQLTAADLILFSRRNIIGVAMAYGGSTSHVAIMARSLGIPTVTGFHTLPSTREHGHTVILDALRGYAIMQPNEHLLAQYERMQARYAGIRTQLLQSGGDAPTSQDGTPITLRANLELAEELPHVLEVHAQGIGLFRTEIMSLVQGKLKVDEDEVFETYAKIVQAFPFEPVTFRLLDLGGDKLLPMAHREANPFLGWRGIRVLLDKPSVLAVQVRAILRASAGREAHIMIPMVSSLSEISQVRAAIEAVSKELDYPCPYKLGIMVEVPAVALAADQFAKAVDFFSIGSNDLTQYTLAVDRGNDLVGHLFSEFNPGVLSLIQKTIAAASRAGIPVSLCGEMASKPGAIPLLLGLGLRQISASWTYLPEIRELIRHLRIDECEALVARALLETDAEPVHEMCCQFLDDHPFDLEHLLEGPNDLSTLSA
ncbi:MAG: phosphoenolpyruvate--protein phosphotransferase [Bacteroidetes bacterium]|nr:phosphoenolpyruvate--protein phosphotransferase [Bacteroidota bacterium]